MLATGRLAHQLNDCDPDSSLSRAAPNRQHRESEMQDRRSPLCPAERPHIPSSPQAGSLGTNGTGEGLSERGHSLNLGTILESLSVLEYFSVYCPVVFLIL